jgi:hypothetical protein
MIVNTVLVMIIFFSIVTIALIVTFLIQLPDSEKYPILKDFFDRLGKTAKAFVQQVIPIVLFASWTSSLPSLLTGKNSLRLQQKCKN